MATMLISVTASGDDNKPVIPKIPNPRPPHPGSIAASTTDPARTPPRKPGGTGWERTAAAPLVCPECGGIIIGPSHTCKPRLDPVSEAWAHTYRTLAPYRPFASGRALGAEVEQELTGAAA